MSFNAEADELPSLMPQLQLNRGFISKSPNDNRSTNNVVNNFSNNNSTLFTTSNTSNNSIANTNNTNNNNQNNLIAKVESCPMKSGLALMMAGRAVMTQFRQMSNDHFIMSITKPGFVKEFGLSIADLNSFPQNVGIIIYYSLFPFKDWQILNNESESDKSPVLYIDNPTKIFKSPWIHISGITHCPLCYLGLQLKSLEYIKSIETKPKNILHEQLQENKSSTSTSSDENLETVDLERISNGTFEFIAKKIGKNLYNFLSSYTKTLATNEGGNVIVAPTNVMDQWFDRFKTKLTKDKSFLKNAD